MAEFNKITFDPRSGRPIAPSWWRLSAFFMVYAWIFAAVMIIVAYLGVRNDQPVVSAMALAAGAIIVLFAHRNRQRVKRESEQFDLHLVAFERVLSRDVNGS